MYHWTRTKLAYAGVQLNELRTYEAKHSNNEWENAHQESVLYHLAGAVESLLQAINEAYQCGLSIHAVTWQRLADRLKTGPGKISASAAFNRLESLRHDKSSWLSLLFELRNHGTHRTRVGRYIYLATGSNPENQFMDPRTGQPQTIYPALGCQGLLERLEQDVHDLVDECFRIDQKLANLYPQNE